MFVRRTISCSYAQMEAGNVRKKMFCQHPASSIASPQAMDYLFSQLVGLRRSFVRIATMNIDVWFFGI